VPPLATFFSALGFIITGEPQHAVGLRGSPANRDPKFLGQGSPG
jgi:hypothetical protein